MDPRLILTAPDHRIRRPEPDARLGFPASTLQHAPGYNPSPNPNSPSHPRPFCSLVPMDTSPASSTSSITYKDDSSIEDFPSPGPIPAVNESSALLPGADQSAAESQLLKPRKMTPVPKLQLAILCVARLLEPIGFTQLFPYVNEMVVKFKMIDDPSKAGFVSGLVVSNWFSMP